MTLVAMNNLATGYRELGRTDDAIALYEETLRLSTERLGERHADTLTSMLNLGDVYLSIGKTKEAEPKLLAAYRGFAARTAANSTPVDEQKVQQTVRKLIEIYEKKEQFDEASKWKKELEKLLAKERPAQPVDQ
jgi:tetratricopeptide (TPR) repeat protein